MNSTSSIALLVLGASIISFVGGYLLPKKVDPGADYSSVGVPKKSNKSSHVQKTSVREIRGENVILKFNLSRRPMSESSPTGWGMAQTPEGSSDEYVVDVSGRYREADGVWAKLYIDASIFANLYNVNWETVKVTEKGPSAKITFSGADAGSSYRAELMIDNGRFASKRVEDGEFPQNFREECIYTSIPFVD